MSFIERAIYETRHINLIKDGTIPNTTFILTASFTGSNLIYGVEFGLMGISVLSYLISHDIYTLIQEAESEL